MWIFDGEQWHQDHDTGSRAIQEQRPREMPGEFLPELQVVEITSNRLEERKNLLPWMKN